MSLSSHSIPVSEVSDSDLLRMYELMETHYENTCFQEFQKDLMEKVSALILRDEAGIIQGFTTLMTYRLESEGIPIQLVFSGDTIIRKMYWGEAALHKAWIREIYSMLEDDIQNAYWLLISKGYKTYRFLPVYFKDFYPNARKATPAFEKGIMDSFCRLKYPDNYDPHRGIISFGGTRDYLKQGIADVEERHQKDLDISFFLEMNPGYLVGDELVCLTRLNTNNIKPRGLRYLKEMVR